MAAGKRRKRVSWAPEVKLRQVRFFLSEDAPALSRLGAQENLRAKASLLRHRNGSGPGDRRPEFKRSYPVTKQKIIVPRVPLVKWESPCEMILDSLWLVAAGEESKEMEEQKQRQVRALEAFYPRAYSIPPNPSISSKEKYYHYDDTFMPLIPITAIEEEECDPSSSTSVVEPSLSTPPKVCCISLPINQAPQSLQLIPDPLEKSQPTELPIQREPFSLATPSFEFTRGAEPDIGAAVSAACTAIIKSSAQGSLIDQELLIKVLSDPKMVEKLVVEYGSPKEIPQPAVAPKQEAHTTRLVKRAPQLDTAPKHPPPLDAAPKQAGHEVVVLKQMLQSPVILKQLPQLAVAAKISLPPAMDEKQAPLEPMSPKQVSSSAISQQLLPPPMAPQKAPSTTMVHNKVTPSTISPMASSLSLPKHSIPNAAYPSHPTPFIPEDSSIASAVNKPMVDTNTVKDDNYYKSLIQLHGVKDISYYQSLIQKHGTENEKAVHISYVPKSSHNQRKVVGRISMELEKPIQPVDSRVRYSKPCVFFNSPRGCKHGSKCLFLHDSPSLSEQNNRKRIRLDRGFIGGS